jgi:hypothetical protein
MRRPRPIVPIVSLCSVLTLAAAHEEPVAPAGKPAAAPAPARGLPAGPQSADDVTGLPPLPEGVAALRFREFFRPPGRKGLEYADRLRALEGQRVRILGFMVRQDEPRAGLFLLAPRPVTLHESEYGPCDDLPPAVLHVHMPERDRAAPVAHTPGLLLLTGRLRLGNRLEADGRLSSVRLELEAPPAKAAGTGHPPNPSPAPKPASPPAEPGAAGQPKEQRS